MKKSLFYTFGSAICFIAASFLGNTNSFAGLNNASLSSKKIPGAIIVGWPAGCDCTAPGNSCYCVVPDEPVIE